MKNICCFCEKWGSGGIETFLLNTFEHMDRKDLHIDLVTTQIESSLYLPRLKACGVDLICLGRDTRHLLANHAAFRRLLRRKHYDVLHLNIYHALSLLYARDAARLGVSRRIAHSHNAGLRNSLLRPLKLSLHHLARNRLSGFVTECFACSRDAADFMFPAAAAAEILPNGIDLTRFAYDGTCRQLMRVQLGLADRFVLGSVGRLCQQKNHAFLLDVLQELKHLRPDAALLLVGEGELLPELQAKIRQLGLSDSVHFYGTSHDVPKLLCAMDVFALPSLFEGLGIAAIEAQACALPTFCSEFVPEEALASPLALRLSLSAPPAVWAEHMLAASSLRQPVTEELRRAGYDIRSTAGRLEKAYREEDRH